MPPKAKQSKGEIKGYSVKAKKMVSIQDPVLSMTSNGRKIVKGTCPETGGKVCVFVSDDFTGEGILDTIISFVKPLAKPLLEKVKDKALEVAKQKAGEIAGELAGKAVGAVGDKIKSKIKGKGIDSVPHREQVKTMFYAPIGGEGLYLPGSAESKTGYKTTARKRPVGTSSVAHHSTLPAPAPAQVASQPAIAPQQKMGGDGRKRGKGLF